MTKRVLLVVFALLYTSSAWAAVGPDLAVTVTPPPLVRVYQTAGFNVRVANAGPKAAASVTLTIQLPRTRTSPTVYIMGTLGTFSTACTRSNTNLVCGLGPIGKGQSQSVFFDISLPYSTAPLVITAVAATSGEMSPANNTAAYTVNPLTVAAALSSAAPAINRHCTGQPTLSSYFECTLFPSSITSHQTTFNADGTLTFFDGPSTMNGTWVHTPSANRLQFSYYDGTLLVAQFDGRGVSAGCFEGKTTFPDNPGYVSMYQVCFP